MIAVNNQTNNYRNYETQNQYKTNNRNSQTARHIANDYRRMPQESKGAIPKLFNWIKDTFCCCNVSSTIHDEKMSEFCCIPVGKYSAERESASEFVVRKPQKPFTLVPLNTEAKIDAENSNKNSVNNEEQRSLKQIPEPTPEPTSGLKFGRVGPAFGTINAVSARKTNDKLNEELDGTAKRSQQPEDMSVASQTTDIGIDTPREEEIPQEKENVRQHHGFKPINHYQPEEVERDNKWMERRKSADYQSSPTTAGKADASHFDEKKSASQEIAQETQRQNGKQKFSFTPEEKKQLLEKRDARIEKEKNRSLTIEEQAQNNLGDITREFLEKHASALREKSERNIV